MKSRELIGIILIFLVISSASIYFMKSEALYERKENPTLKIEDQAGRTVEIPKNVDNIIATGPGALRFVAYLDAAEKVVGVEQIEKSWAKELPYSLANPRLRELPVIGPPFGGNPELIMDQEPDVIFWRFGSKEQAEKLQDKTGTPVIILGEGAVDPWRDNTFYKSLRLVSKVLNKEERADKVIHFVESTIQNLKNRTRNIPSDERKEAYIGAVAWGKSGKGITSTMPNYEPFRLVNAKNVASEIDKWHANINEEKILTWDPERIFIDQDGYSSAKKSLEEPAYRSVKAVENGEVYRLWPYHSYEINFGMILTNSYYVGKTLYPKRFNDVLIKEKANEIFENLLGAKIYDNVVNGFGELSKVQIEN